MEEVSLDQICDIQIGKTPSRAVPRYWGKGYPWVSISDMKSSAISETKEQITQEAIKECGCKILPKGTLMMSFKLSIGKLAIAETDLFTNEAIAGFFIKNKNEVIPEYLLFALKAGTFAGSNNAVMGATLNKDSLRKIRIPKPSLIEQKRIVSILSRVESLISKRKESIALLDEYLKSVFLEMFEKYISANTDEFLEIGKLATFIDYRGKTPERVETGVPFISAKCVRKGYFDLGRLDYITNETYNKIMTRGIPKTNDILFTTEGATMGFTCRIPKGFNKFAIGQRIITLQVKEKLTSEYLDFILNHSYAQKEIFKRSSGSAVLGIRSSEFEEIKLPVPPFKLQAQFSDIVERVESVKINYQQSLSELENMYGVLSQSAFTN